MTELPAGMLTLLFTDVEGSTRLRHAPRTSTPVTAWRRDVETVVARRRQRSRRPVHRHEGANYEAVFAIRGFRPIRTRLIELRKQNVKNTPTGMWLLYTLLYADAGQLAESIALTWLAESSEQGQGAQTVYLNVMLAELRWRQGRLRESHHAAGNAWDLARVLGRSFTSWWIAIAVLAQTLLARGHNDAAHDLLARNDLLDGPPPLVWSMPSLGAVRAQVLLAAGQVERGVAELHAFDTWRRSLDFPSPGGWWYPGDLVEGLMRLDRRSDAIEVAQRWHTETADFGSPVVTGQALRAVGLACDDIEPLEEAVQQLERTSARLAHARALLDLASALRRRGQRTRARPLLRRTIALATTADAHTLAAHAHHELLATGARPRRTAVTGIDALTASERRVAELAAQGRSNPEIAAQLYITRKTVEKHLAATFDKLGVHTRHVLPDLLADSRARTPSRDIDRTGNSTTGHTEHGGSELFGQSGRPAKTPYLGENDNR